MLMFELFIDHHSCSLVVCEKLANLFSEFSKHSLSVLTSEAWTLESSSSGFIKRQALGN